MHPHCLICQHGAECLRAWQLDWAQRGHNICIFSCFHREMGWRGKNVRWVNARQSIVYTYRGGTKEGNQMMTPPSISLVVYLALTLTCLWPRAVSLQEAPRSFLPNSLLLSYSYAWRQQQWQATLTYWVPTVCFTHIPFDPYNNPMS